MSLFRIQINGTIPETIDRMNSILLKELFVVCLHILFCNMYVGSFREKNAKTNQKHTLDQKVLILNIY